MIGPAHRKTMTDRYAEGTLDLVHVHFRCERCGAPSPDRKIRTMGDVTYRDLDGLVALASRFLREALHESASCPECGQQARAYAADYHVFTAGRDLVLRLLADAPAIELLWWNGAAFSPADLSASDRAGFERDARYRRVQALLEVQGFDVAFPELEKLADERKGDPALMRHVPRLVHRGRTSLAARILHAQLDARPDDPEVTFWLAEICIRLVNAGQWGVEQLGDAEHHLRSTLAKVPGHRAALVAMSSIYRLRDEDDRAIQILEQLLAAYPDDAPAHYNLAVMLLPTNPGQALGHFEAGERADSRDADYPIGVARALLALGRREDARAPLERARKLDPKHPRLAQLDAALG